jgi:hypothetical protein
MSDNDVIELGWLECEFFASEKSKWDGVLFKVGDKSCSAGLIEFSEGCNGRTSNQVVAEVNDKDVVVARPNNFLSHIKQRWNSNQ